MERKIIHVDMDAFYASIEQRDFPHLKGQPIAVGGSSDRGVVAAASYEARKYGVRSAMPVKTALKKCPHLILTPPRFKVYKEVSKIIHSIFHEYTHLVEPLSLDEAFLDVTEPLLGPASATLIAKEIRKRIFDETQLTASAGISYNKFLAKVCSDVNKPNGQFVLPPEKATDFIAELPIKRFFGIGKVTAAKLHDMGVNTGADLLKMERSDLVRNFGKAGGYFYNICRGIDLREVNPTRIRKSVGAERTFETDITNAEELHHRLKGIVEKTLSHMERINARGKTITVKVKYADFEQQTRSKTYANYLDLSYLVYTQAAELLDTYSDQFHRGIRLLGMSFTNLNLHERNTPVQLTIDF
ncbi:DNA polymerase IV [Prolixibacteraceae bacterium JC049]|nr:DNA polymerase IV [Prolixibacteraceae bacterium JC049]